MSDSRRRKPLVADRRVSKGSAAKPAPRKKAVSSRGRGRGPRKGRGGLVGLILFVPRLLLRMAWGIGWRMGAIGAIVLALAVGYQYLRLPPLDALLDGRARGSVTLLDRDGKVFAWRGDQFGGVVTAQTVSPYLKNAIIATEDRRFYRHFGGCGGGLDRCIGPANTGASVAA